MDERQERGATDSHLPATKTRETTEAHLPQQVLRGAKLEVRFRILVGSSPLASELVLERRTREFQFVVVDQLDVEVFKTFQQLDRLADHTRRRRILRLLVRGFEHPNAPRWHLFPRQWNAEGGRHCERAAPTAASRCVLAVGRGTQLAHKVQFQVSSTLQAGVDSTGLGVDRKLLRDEERAAPVVFEASLRVADVSRSASPPWSAYNILLACNNAIEDPHA